MNSIDLAWLPSGNLGTAAVLTELKWESNTPIFAAFEILQYGIAYLFARKFLSKDYGRTPLMSKRAVLLNVLAPPRYYHRFPGRENLERSLNSAINTLAQQHLPHDNLRMGFRFTELPEALRPPWKLEDLAPAIANVEQRLSSELLSLLKEG